MNTIAFFNNKGGVGKTTLIYHLAWMFSDLGARVIAADLDPQANLTAMFISEERLEDLWPDGDHAETILGVVNPIMKGTGDIANPHVEEITENLGLIVGDLGLSRFEAKLSDAWPRCVDEDESAFRVVSSFYRMIQRAAHRHNATCALVDVGPNLGAINRSAMIAADFVVVPIAADLYSLQGLKNLGPTLREWRKQWEDRAQRRPRVPNLELPRGQMQPAGYVVLQHAVRLDRPVKAYERWMSRIPGVYRQEMLDQGADGISSPLGDPNCLASLKHYGSLMPLAQDALKPMFHLKPADGALGAHTYAVQSCYADFRNLARELARACEVVLPIGTSTLT